MWWLAGLAKHLTAAWRLLRIRDEQRSGNT